MQSKCIQFEFQLITRTYLPLERATHAMAFKYRDREKQSKTHTKGANGESSTESHSHNASECLSDSVRISIITTNEYADEIRNHGHHVAFELFFLLLHKY